MALEPAPVRLLHRARTKQQKILRPHAGHREIAVELSLRREHRAERHAPGLRDSTRKQAIEEFPRSRPTHRVLGEIRDLQRAHRLAHGFHLAGHVSVGARTAEGRLLVRILRPIGKPQRVLQPEALPPHRTLGCQVIVERSGLLPTALGEGLVGESHHEAALVVLGGFHGAPIGRGKGAEARHIHRPHIDRGLAVDHPLGHAQTHAPALAKSCHHAHRHPVVAQTRHRPDQRVAVGAEGEGTVHDVLDAGAPQGGNALETELEALGDVVELGCEQLSAEILRRTAQRPRRGAWLVGA